MSGLTSSGRNWSRKLLTAAETAAVLTTLAVAGLVRNDATAAAANTAAIQAALTAGAGGDVVVAIPGDIYVNATLIVPANTRFVRGSNTTLRATGSAAFLMIRNANANSTPVQITSISATAFGRMSFIVTATFSAAHGLSAGGCVQVKGDASQTYEGIWDIYDVPSPTSVRWVISSGAGSTSAPPALATAVASASQTVASPGVFSGTNTFATGQAVTLTNPPTGFTAGTIYYVISSGLTGSTFQLATSPFATAGIAVTASSATCVVSPYVIGASADKNVVIEGGRINYDATNRGISIVQDWSHHAIFLRRVKGSHVKDVSFFDVDKYAVCLQDVYDPTVEGIDGYSLADCVHVYGPAYNPVIRDIRGSWGDDIAVLQTIDGSMYLGNMMGAGFDCGGDIVGAKISNIRPHHTHQSGSVVLYPNGNSGGAGATAEIYRIRGLVSVDGSTVRQAYVSGSWFGGIPVNVGNGYVTVTGKIEHLELIGCPMPKLDNAAATTQLYIQNLSIRNPQMELSRGVFYSTSISYVTVENLEIYGPVVNSTVGGAWFGITTNGAVNNANVFGGSFTNSATAIMQVIYLGGGSLGQLTFHGTKFASTTTYVLYPVASGNSASTVTDVHYEKCQFGAYVRPGDFVGFALPCFANTPTYHFEGCRGLANHGGIVVATGAQPFNVVINDLTAAASSFGGAFNVYSYTGTANLRMTNMNVSSGFTNASGTLNFFGDGSLALDATTITPMTGSIYYNTSTTYNSASGAGIYLKGPTAVVKLAA